MGQSRDQFARGVFSGTDRSAKANALRLLLGASEPGYAALMRLRNAGYDRGWLRTHNLNRPAVSVGNLTAGGTGKTPVVRWLAQAMRNRGRRPAVLMRGYMHGIQRRSDEADLLAEQLNGNDQTPVEIEVNPDRVAGAAAVLKRSPPVDLFILDDGFQHRRARRNFDLVLIDATEPFGFDHVHPRGLLREPKGGLRRADAVLLTRCDLVDATHLASVEREIRRWNSRAPIYRSSHRHTALLAEDGASISISELSRRKFFAFGGIGRPEALHRQLQSWGATYAGFRWFEDHHAYTDRDAQAVLEQAKALDAQLLVTTAKDWVKLASWKRLCSDAGLPIHRIELEFRFEAGDHRKLLEQIDAACAVSA